MNDTVQQPLHHRFVPADGTSPPGCTCGWMLDRPGSPQLNHRRWYLHLDVARAARRKDEAIGLMRQLQRRAVELRGVRSQTVQRRAAVVQQRVDLARQLGRVRVGSAAPISFTAVHYLDRARRMADLTMTTLWIRYVAVGGNLDLEQLRSALLGTRPIAAQEYNHIALAVNEAFADMGLGHPIDFVTSREDRDSLDDSPARF